MGVFFEMQALILVSLASVNCAHPPAEGGWGGGWLRACRLLCAWVTLSPSPASHGAFAATEVKVWCGLMLCWAQGNTAIRGCGRGVLVTLLQPFLPEKRGSERRAHSCGMQGMEGWSTKQLSQLVRSLLLCWAARPGEELVLFLSLGQKCLLTGLFFLECIERRSLIFFFAWLPKLCKSLFRLFFTFFPSLKCYIHLCFSS